MVKFAPGTDPYYEHRERRLGKRRGRRQDIALGLHGLGMLFSGIGNLRERMASNRSEDALRNILMGSGEEGPPQIQGGTLQMKGFGEGTDLRNLNRKDMALLEQVRSNQGTKLYQSMQMQNLMAKTQEDFRHRQAVGGYLQEFQGHSDPLGRAEEVYGSLDPRDRKEFGEIVTRRAGELGHDKETREKRLASAKQYLKSESHNQRNQLILRGRNAYDNPDELSKIMEDALRVPALGTLLGEDAQEVAKNELIERLKSGNKDVVTVAMQEAQRHLGAMEYRHAINQIGAKLVELPKEKGGLYHTKAFPRKMNAAMEVAAENPTYDNMKAVFAEASKLGIGGEVEVMAGKLGDASPEAFRELISDLRRIDDSRPNLDFMADDAAEQRGWLESMKGIETTIEAPHQRGDQPSGIPPREGLDWFQIDQERKVDPDLDNVLRFLEGDR